MEKTRSFPVPFFFLISFIEGGSVMAVELIGAKLIAPFFGNSLYVWASVLGVTLGGLSIGYFVGGSLSKKFPSEGTLLWILLIAAFTVLWMAPWGKFVMKGLLSFSVIPATLIACMSFIFPPLLLFGMSSPVIINLITDEESEAGRSSGRIYAISTTGGIIMTFLTGFWLIPLFGLSNTLFAVGSVLFFFVAGAFLYKKKGTPLIFALITLWAVILFLRSLKNEEDGGRFMDVVHRSEGLLGELVVLDFLGADGDPHRCMYVNYSGQTCMNLTTREPGWPYVERVAALSAHQRKNEEANALVCGLAGGLLVNELMKRGIMNVDVVELDERMPPLARKHFGMSEAAKVIIDDARHYIRSNKKRYNVIVFDMIHAESPPSNVYTLSAFQEVKKSLRDSGVFILHYNNSLKGKGGKAVRSIGRTLEKAGFHAAIMNNEHPPRTFAERLFYAVPKEAELNRKKLYNSAIKHLEDQKLYKNSKTLFLDTLSFSKGVILTDERPRVDLLEANSVKRVRKKVMGGLLKRLREKGIPIVE